MPLGNDALSMAGTVVAAILTLLVFSYLLGDNALFRIAIYIFIGVAAGYAGAVAVEDIIYPQLILPLQAIIMGATTPTISLNLGMKLILSLLLLNKLNPRAARFGNPVVALMAGAGAALAVLGAVQGTILPQVASAVSYFDAESFDLAMQGGYYGEAMGVLFNGAILLLATVGTLAYFHFGARDRGKQVPQRNLVVDALAWVGRIFIAITLAALFTGVLQAALAALIERLVFFINAVSSLVGGG